MPHPPAHAADESTAQLRGEVEELRMALDRSQAAARRAAELQRATSALAAALGAPEAAEIFLAVGERVCGAGSGAVYVLDACNRLQLQAARGPGRPRTLAADATTPLADAARRNQPHWLGRAAFAAEDPDAASELPDAQAVAVLPLTDGTRGLGAVSLEFAEPHRFDAEERELLSHLAGQCALAVERARLYAAEREARREAETLFRVAESLGSAQLDPEAIVQRLTDEGTALVGAELGAFFQNVTNADGQAQILYTVSGPRREVVRRLGLTPNTALVAPTFVDQRAVRLTDARADPRGAGSPLGVASYLAVPVVSNAKTVIGGLFFGHAEPGRFTEQHQRVVQALAAHAAVAIENARLYRSTRAAELQQRHLVEELAETVRLNDLFTGVLAHDLRNPLTGIITSVHLAQMRGPAEPMVKPLARIATSAERMRRMVEQLLEFARARLGETMPLSARAADLTPIVHHAMEELQDAHAPRLVIERTGDTTGVWDGDRLGQVFSNLIGNAVQHGAGREVRIRLDGNAHDGVTFRIHNDGAIPAPLLPHLFEPLAGGQSARGGSRGLGLGLYIAQQIVRAHGGRLEVQSTEQDGTTFTLTLPRAAPEAAAPGAPRPTVAEAKERAWQIEQRMRLLVDSIRDYAIFMLDPEGHVTSWNIGAQRLKGYTAAEILGKHISTFYGPADREAGRPQLLLAEAASQGRVEDLGWRVRKDGTRFWADVVITALKDSNGGLIGFAKVTRDLSERREDEERLRRSEEQFRLMVDSVRDYAIFKLDPNGIVTTWNAGAERIKGYRAPEIIGQHFSRFYEEEDVLAGKCARELEQAAREGQTVDEGWRLRKDGTRFWASVVITALRDPSGALVGFTKVTRDLTERKKLEDERVRSARAEEALRLRDEFLSMASHELKTPLTGLQLQLQALERRLDVGDEKVALNLQRASESSERLAALVESLLDVSRITAGHFELETEFFDLAALVRACADAFQPRAAKAGCRLQVDAPDPVIGRWDRPRVETLVTGLVMNAIKYGAGTPIDVSVGAAGDTAVLEVRDHGPGLSAPALDDMFTRFHRQVSPRHYGGLGLGLYLVREIARAHGGDVVADNAPDGGARFVVRLPLEVRPALEASPQELQ